MVIWVSYGLLWRLIWTFRIWNQILKILNIPAVRIFSNLFLNLLLTFSTEKKSAQNRLKIAPMAWTTSRVGQIWCQIDFLIFLKKKVAVGFPGFYPVQPHFDSVSGTSSKGEKTERVFKLTLATDLETRMAGFRQIQLVDLYCLSRSKELWAILPSITRIGHDIDPLQCLHWRPDVDAMPEAL